MSARYSLRLFRQTSRRFRDFPKYLSLSARNNQGKVLLCAGQGAQYVGMFGNTSLQSNQIANIMKIASEVAGFDVLELCRSGPKTELDKTENCQLIVVLSSLIAAEILRDSNPDAINKADAIAGYSVGEIAALALGGSISYEDAFHLVKARGKAMQEASDREQSGMIFLQGASSEVANEMCDRAAKSCSGGICQIAIESFDKGFAIGGTRECLSWMKQAAKDQGFTTSHIAVSGAFHTPLMESALAHYNEALVKVTFRKPQSAVISNVTGDVHKETESIPQLLLDHLVKPVKWRQAIETIGSRHKTIQFYELGPGKQLKPMMGKINRKLLKHYVNITV